MRIAAILFSALLLTVTTVCAGATVRIAGDSGGRIGTYTQSLEYLRNSGEQVMIDGPCLSACTMVLGFVARNRICVTPRAQLGFHAAWDFDAHGRQVTNPKATEFLMSVYPEQVVQWIKRRGGLQRSLKFLKGRELSSMYQHCPAQTSTRPWVHASF